MEVRLVTDHLVTVSGWETRHELYPAIADEIHRARTDSHFQLMYRGEAAVPPLLDEIFLVGRKARPANYGGSLHRLAYNTRRVAEEQKKFEEIARAYLRSPMFQHVPEISLDELMQRYEGLEAHEQYTLTKLLLDSLHYQNLKPEAKVFRDFLFIMSCTKEEKIALKYALHQTKGCPPREVFVFEYAPPTTGGFFRATKDVIRELDIQGLGLLRRDVDSEFFVYNAMLPHYLLGYARLVLTNGIPDHYETEYVPNRYYTDEGATLVNPPDLNDAQEPLIAATLKQLAWVEHGGKDWDQIHHRVGATDISPPASSHN